MNPADAVPAQPLLGDFDPRGHFIRRFDMIDLHLDHSDAKLDPGIHFFESIQVVFRAAGQFKYPGGIAVDENGNVYVTDSAHGDNNLDLGNARVQVFTGTGTFVTQWDNGFGFPTGIGVDSGGNVYVADNLHDRIQKFSN